LIKQAIDGSVKYNHYNNNQWFTIYMYNDYNPNFAVKVKVVRNCFKF